MNWITKFPELTALETDVQNTLVKNSTVVDVKSKTTIFGPGKAAENLLLVIEGTVRVQQLSSSGREIVLYRVRTGESCVLTTTSLLAYQNYSAEGVAETDVQAVAIPAKVFDDLLARSTAFRKFVFNVFSQRFTELFHVVEDVAFQRIDVRLAAKIIELSDENETLNATHQQLARELGSAREVISRQLLEFQRRGWVELSRGAIRLADKSRLQILASD